jgi:hypothetical protein
VLGFLPQGHEYQVLLDLLDGKQHSIYLVDISFSHYLLPKRVLIVNIKSLQDFFKKQDEGHHIQYHIAEY